LHPENMTAPSDDVIHTSSPLAGYQALKTEIDAAIQAVLNQPAHVLAPVVGRFERQFAAFIGVTHGIGVNNGTDALHLSLRALGIGRGDEVITVSHTSVATVAAIEMSGADAVLVDIELPWCTIDPHAAEAAITQRTRAIIAVHLYGQPANLTRLRDIADRNGIALIEDCAQSHGATWNARMTGSWGEASCFSFYPSKNLGTVGDGGMVLTHDAGLASRISSLRQYGWSAPQMSALPGWNSRLGSLEAAILEVKLKSLPAMIAARRQIAARYLESLAGLPLLLPRAREGSEHAWHLFVIRCEDQEARHGLKQHLATRGIMAGLHYPLPVHLQPAYRGRCRTTGMASTEAIVPQILSIPIYPELRADQQSRVIAAIREYYEASQ
jgi:dTDP-4-amino-4,6-dideoxygalactose transaminase